jgi:hypothetical protein
LRITRAAGRRRRVEAQPAGLLTGVGLDLQRLIVFPRDAQAAGHAHQSGSTVGLARAILGGVPLVGGLDGGRRERQAGVVALRRRDHPPLPVLADHRHPVAGQIHRRDRAGRRWRRTRATILLRKNGRRRKHERQEHQRAHQLLPGARLAPLKSR